MGQVGQHRDVVGDGPDAVLGQAVRARLEHREAVAGLDHGRQVGLQDRRLGRRRAGRVAHRSAADDHVDRADEAGRQACLAQDGAHQVGRRGLAIGARDAHHAEAVRGIVPPPGRRLGQGRPSRDHDELGHGEAGQGALHDDGGGARRDRGGREVVPVVDPTRDRHEDLAGPDVARVHGDAGHGTCRERLPWPTGLRGSGGHHRAELAAGLEGTHERAERAAAADGLAHRLRSARRAERATRPARYRTGRSTSSWAPTDSTQSAPNPTLCS